MGSINRNPNITIDIIMKKIQFIFAGYDFWMGFFYDKKNKWLYFLPLPTLGIIFKLKESKFTRLLDKLKAYKSKEKLVRYV